MLSRRSMIIGATAAATHSLLASVNGDDSEHRVSKADVEKMLKDLSNWGRWGKEDELGTLNLITPEKRRQAAGLVQEGVSVSLAHDIVKIRMDDSSPFEHEVTINNPKGEIGGSGDRYSVSYHGFTHTHIDALCHVFYKGQMYNGFSTDVVKKSGAGRLSVHALKQGILTKAVLMDIPELLGVRYLKGDVAIYPEHLEAWEKKSGVRVESGDAMIIHTGRWTRRQSDGAWKIMDNSAGLHASCLPWIRERDISLIGSDLALDLLPSQVEGIEMPVHLVVVVGLGMCILDVLDCRAVAEAARQRKRWEFMLNVCPLAVGGGTGSPINPIATF